MNIPKKIHYCWFGGKPMPKMLRFCIQSWKKHLPDYEFFCWNENNTSFDCDFVKKAYDLKKWAFVSDYVRLKSVYDYGGIYLDTDILLLKSLNDFLDNTCFFVAEHKKSINPAVFGSEPNNHFIEVCLESYRLDKDAFIPIPKIVSDNFVDTFHQKRNFEETLILSDIVIYEPIYFYGLPYSKLFDIHNYKDYVAENSYGVHLWHGSWHSYNELVLLRRKEYYPALKKIYSSIFKERKLSAHYFKKVLNAFKDSILTPNAFK
jgi:mannosyltransferase OCH1-like enzyme